MPSPNWFRIDRQAEYAASRFFSVVRCFLHYSPVSWQSFHQAALAPKAGLEMLSSSEMCKGWRVLQSSEKPFDTTRNVNT